jgi:transcription-repair coupling factor (superfamily II helicase)
MDLSLNAAPKSAVAAAYPPTEVKNDLGVSPVAAAQNSPRTPVFQGLDAFRPVVDRAPEPQVAEAQRREFFVQLHRWSRQGYDVHVFCNNDGERQRFTEIWREYGFDDEQRAPNAAGSNAVPNALSSALKPEISTHLGSLTRGFIYEEGKLVVVTDAEIFGRYKVQRPRRLSRGMVHIFDNAASPAQRAAMRLLDGLPPANAEQREARCPSVPRHSP